MNRICHFLLACVQPLGAVFLALVAASVHAAGSGALTLVDPNPPHIIRGVAYSNTAATASGGTGPYSFVANSGLPTGMSLATDGTLSGTTCGANGNYVASFTVTDSTAATATDNVHLIVNAAPPSGCSLTFSGSTLPAGTVGVGYNQTVSATGGTPPYTYALGAGSLPPGLTLAGHGAISGIPVAAGTYSFSLTATDPGGATGVQSLSITVHPAVVTLTAVSADGTVTLTSTGSPATQQGVAYSQANSATGGTAPYVFAVSGGALPAAVLLDASTGLASGTPTAAGPFSYTVRVTDAVGAAASQTISGVISAAAPSVAVRPDPSTDPEVRTLVRQQIDAMLRLAHTQIANVGTRLQALHGATALNCSGASGRAMQPIAPPGDRSASVVNLPTDACIDDGPNTVWSTGSLEVGSSDATAGGHGFGFHTKGVTLGWDRAVATTVRLGVAFGLTSEKTDNSGSRTSNSAKGGSAMAYLSYQPHPLVFVDALLGYGRVRMDSRRVALNSVDNPQGSRSGSEIFGSLATGYRLSNVLWTVVPYARADLVRGRLSGFTESTAGSEGLQFGTQSVPSLRTALGLEASTVRYVAWGALTPRAKAEWQREFHRSEVSTLSYASDPNSLSYQLDLGRLESNIFSLELGTDLQLRNHWSLGVGYEYRRSEASESNRIMLRISKSIL